MTAENKWQWTAIKKTSLQMVQVTIFGDKRAAEFNFFEESNK